MNITKDFYTDLFEKGLQRNHTFECELTLPTHLNKIDTEDILRIRTEFTSLQTPILTTAPVRHGNTVLKSPIEREYEQITIGFLPDESLEQYHIIESWMDSIIKGHGLTSISYHDEIVGNIKISLFDNKNNERTVFELSDVFPTNISPMDVNKTIKDDVVRFTATFIYSYLYIHKTDAPKSRNTPKTKPNLEYYSGLNSEDKFYLGRTNNKLELSRALKHEFPSKTQNDIIDNMSDQNVLTGKELSDVKLTPTSILNNYDIYSNISNNIPMRSIDIISKIISYDNTKQLLKVSTSDNHIITLLDVIDDNVKKGLNILNSISQLNSISANITVKGLMKVQNEGVKKYEYEDPIFLSLSYEKSFSLDKIKNILS